MNYGSEFRRVRLARGKTQQETADYIGKSNMLISGIETGKNKVFSDDDFIKITEYLSFTEEEKMKLHKLAMGSNNRMPRELTEFICSSDKMADLLETIRVNRCNDEQIEVLIQYCKKIMKEKA